MDDLMQIETVADRTYRLEPHVPGIGIILSSYLIDSGGGVLVEPGPSTAIPPVLEAMHQVGMTRLSYIIPTHLHMDHAGGTGSLAQMFPDARVILHPVATRHLIDTTRLVESTRVTYGEGFERLYGPILPVPESRILVPGDGDTLPIGEGQLEIVYAPGHAPHHVAALDRSTGCLFCGEALGMPTRNPLPAAAFPSFDLGDCLMTMEKLAALGSKILCYSHGGTARDPNTRIAEAIESTRSFGEMILNSMRDGQSPEAIGNMIRKHGSAHFPPGWGDEMVRVWSAGMVYGYTLYFANKGLA